MYIWVELRREEGSRVLAAWVFLGQGIRVSQALHFPEGPLKFSKGAQVRRPQTLVPIVFPLFPCQRVSKPDNITKGLEKAAKAQKACLHVRLLGERGHPAW